MKKKNAGISTVEVVIAAVILVVVIVGVLVAIKFVTKENSGEQTTIAQRTVSSVSDQVASYVEGADLDITYANNVLKLVSRDDYQIYSFNQQEGKVYFVSKGYSSEMTDEEKVKFVAKITLETAEAEVIGESVSTFLVTVGDLTKADNVVSLKVRVITDTENVNKDTRIATHPSLAAFKNGTYVPPTPTPDPNATPTPTPSPSPTPTPEPVYGVIATNNGLIPNDYILAAPSDAILRVTVKCNNNESPENYTCGGVAFDDYNLDGSPWKITTKIDDQVGDVVSQDFKIKLIQDVMKNKGDKAELYANAYNGYVLVSIEIVPAE